MPRAAWQQSAAKKEENGGPFWALLIFLFGHFSIKPFIQNPEEQRMDEGGKYYLTGRLIVQITAEVDGSSVVNA